MDTENSSKESEVQRSEKEFSSQECQVDFWSTPNENSKTFICNRYINNNVCDAETYTQINIVDRLVIPVNRTKVCDKNCGTSTLYEDKSVECNVENLEKEYRSNGFFGIESIKTDDQLIDICGINFKIFNLFAKKFTPTCRAL